MQAEPIKFDVIQKGANAEPCIIIPEQPEEVEQVYARVGADKLRISYGSRFIDLQPMADQHLSIIVSYGRVKVTEQGELGPVRSYEAILVR